VAALPKIIATLSMPYFGFFKQARHGGIFYPILAIKVIPIAALFVGATKGCRKNASNC